MCTKTKVCRPPEGHVTIILALDIQAIGVWKPFGIAVRCTHHCDHSLALANLLSAQLDIVWREARRVLARDSRTATVLQAPREQAKNLLASASSIRDCATA